MSAWRLLTVMCVALVLAETKSYNKRDTNVDICHESLTNKVQCTCYPLNVTLAEDIRAADCYLTKENVLPEDETWDLFATLKSANQITFTNTKGIILKYLPPRAFNHTKNLTTLIIKYESLETIPPFAFASLKTVEEIILRSNQISTLAKDAFANLDKLKVINFNENKLLEINRNVFINLPEVEKLLLTFNKINTIHDRAFIHLKSLKELDIDRNNLFSLNLETFAGLHDLQKLDLHSNSLEVIGDNTFLPLTKLRSLNLKKNKIQMLDDRAFNGLAKLETLNLAENKLTVLSNEKIFEGLTSLINLNLQGNLMQEFKFEVIQPILQNFYEPLSSLEIDDNNFPCTCKLDWFLDVMNKTRNNTTRLALNNLKCTPSVNLQETYDRLLEKQKAEESENPEMNDEDYYDESQLGGKLFYSDLRELLNCTVISSTATSSETKTKYFQTTAASSNPSITEYTAMTSTYNPVSTTMFTPAKVTNQGVLDLSLDTTDKTTNTPSVFYSDVKKDNSTNSFTTNRLATVSAKPKRNFEDVAEISRTKYDDMASDEAKPESTKGHKRDYPTENEPNNSSNKNYICAFLLQLTLLLCKSSF